jgi:hypothetical protein
MWPKALRAPWAPWALWVQWAPWALCVLVGPYLVTGARGVTIPLALPNFVCDRLAFFQNGALQLLTFMWELLNSIESLLIYYSKSIHGRGIYT